MRDSRGVFVSHRVSFAFEGRADHRQITRAVRGSFFRGLKTSPADAVALPLALRALTAGKASFEVATNSARASSCQRSAWASHLPLFLGSVLARSKHHDSCPFSTGL